MIPHRISSNGLMTAAMLASALVACSAPCTAQPQDLRVPEDEALAEWDWAVTVDEAYQIACDAAGMDLVRDEPWFHYEKLVGFRTPYDTPERRAYWVWAETGDFARFGALPWHWSRHEGNETLEALARNQALRLMPDRFPVEQMQWTVHPSTKDRVEVEGILWGPEFPPIFPRPMCRVQMDPLGGVILRYRQYLCHNLLDAEPTVSYDEALAALSDELGADYQVIAERPSSVTRDRLATYLFHGPNDIHYHIAFTSGDSRGWATIDARTGELRQLHVQPIEPPQPADATDFTDPPIMNE